MPLFKLRDGLGALEDLLDKERAAILAGNFSGLKRLLAEKDRLIKAAGAHRSENILSRVRQKADRNQALLLAASAGVRSVLQRLSRSDSASSAHQTYDRSGKRSKQGSGAGNLKFRA